MEYNYDYETSTVRFLSKDENEDVVYTSPTYSVTRTMASYQRRPLFDGDNIHSFLEDILGIMRAVEAVTDKGHVLNGILDAFMDRADEVA